MTDFKRDIRPIEWMCGDWRFSEHTTGNVDVFYKITRIGCANSIKDAISWAKLHWREVERDYEEPLGKTYRFMKMSK